MKINTLVAGLIAAGVLGAAGYGLFRAGMDAGMKAAPVAAAPATPQKEEPPVNETGEDATRRHMATGLRAGDVDPRNGRKILYYQDPMVPGNKFDQPGKSPFMDMMLSPVYADAAEGADDAGTVAVSPRVRQNLGLRTAEVVEGTLSPEITATGSIAFNERDQAVVQVRTPGYVERLQVRATLDRVSRGQALAELHVPDWVAAQEEFLSVRRMGGTDMAPLIDAARQRMRLVGMSEAQIAQVEQGGRIQPRIVLAAPIAGVVTELAVREGMTVMPGATLLRINGLGTVWADAAVPESQVAPLRIGSRVRATTPAAPGVVFDGTVQAVLPEVDPATRTVKVRLELANPGGRLMPGMSVQMRFAGPPAAPVLLVPSEALIRTGRRVLVMLAEDDGHFRPVEVEAGIDSGDRTEIRRGLHAGQRVVVSSQFLIDSEASLKGVEARLNEGAGAALTDDTPSGGHEAHSGSHDSHAGSRP
ncbi:MAG TPA: efflux RND transporter periplasmic adaptor subunit [Methyloversatilis sp.]